MSADPAIDNRTTMFFVVGAQKAGTTWLHRYLSRHPQVSMGPIKEYSYFKAFHREAQSGKAEQLPPMQPLRRLVARAALLRRAGLARGHLGAVLLALSGKAPSYKDLLRGQGASLAFGDISPRYSSLGRTAFAEMRALHPRSKFIFILRDPVQRMWSQLRMKAKKLGMTEGLTETELAKLTDFATTTEFLARSDYARTMTELEKAVPPSDILYLFYETLFSDPALETLCHHIGVDFVPGDYGARVFEGMKVEIPLATARSLRSTLAPVYDAMQVRFGRDLPTGWAIGSGIMTITVLLLAKAFGHEFGPCNLGDALLNLDDNMCATMRGFRHFDVISSWEGAQYILPGAEKKAA